MNVLDYANQWTTFINLSIVLHTSIAYLPTRTSQPGTSMSVRMPASRRQTVSQSAPTRPGTKTDAARQAGLVGLCSADLQLDGDDRRGRLIRQWSDLLGAVLNWDESPGLMLSDQWSAEVFYRMQLSKNLQLTPSVQYLKDAALNPVHSSVWLAGLRVRLNLRMSVPGRSLN